MPPFAKRVAFSVATNVLPEPAHPEIRTRRMNRSWLMIRYWSRVSCSTWMRRVARCWLTADGVAERGGCRTDRTGGDDGAQDTEAVYVEHAPTIQ